MTPPSENETGSGETPSRRRFLQSAGILGGAIVLGALAENAQAQGAAAGAADAATDAPAQIVLKVNDNPELGKVGGFKVVEFGTDRVIVANTPDGIVACSAICPHKGCDVVYRVDDKQFVCPCHNSRFDLTGKVQRGPARTDLAQYDAQNALIVAPKK